MTSPEGVATVATVANWRKPKEKWVFLKIARTVAATVPTVARLVRAFWGQALGELKGKFGLAGGPGKMVCDLRLA
jgi:hypothetical protein